LALLCLASGPQAAEVDGLYAARVRVADQGVNERNRAVDQAFARVVMKVTGHREVSVAGGASEASGFVKQFRYVSDEPAGPDTQPRVWLKVQFDKTAVDAWIRGHGLNVWGSNRPGTLLWLGIERDGRRRLFVPDLDPATSGLLRRAAEERGLSILLPLSDLEDTRNLTVSDLWGDFDDSIRAASTRYQPDAVLSARVTQVGPDLWRGRWTLLQGGRVARWSNQHGDLGGLLGQGVNGAADRLAARFAPSDSGDRNRLSLRVLGVNSLRDYAAVRTQLESLDLVRQVAITAVDPEALTLQLAVRGDLSGVLSSLRIGGGLTPVSPTMGAPQAGQVLEYRLGP